MKRTTTFRRFAAALVGVALLASGLSSVQPALPAEAVTAAQWDPGNIISDGNFYNAYAMTEAEIQAFLDAKIGTCNNSNCLNVLRAPTTSKVDRYTTAGSLICSSYAGASSERASAIIFKVQQSCGISAKVLLVTLQKEQGLITNRGPTDAKLSRAMGYGCPDHTGGTCDSTYYGFFNQMYSAAWQLKRYGLAPYTYNFQPGAESIRLHPNIACGATSVYIQNYATAALYNYTPYQPNAAALANIGGLGDSCSTYGNRNFWVYYSNWFGNPTQPAGSPEGELTVTVTPSLIAVSGWAVDPDAVTAAVAVSVQIDQNWKATTANVEGASRDAVYPGAGTAHNFAASFPTAPGVHRLCIYLVNMGGAGGQGSLGCRSVTVPSSPAPVGEIATATAVAGTISFTGWAVQPDALSAPVPIAVNFGNQWMAFAADKPNTVAPTRVPGAGPNQGFAGSFAAPAGVQNFCVWAAPSSGPAVQIGCRTVTVPAAQSAQGALQTVTASASAISVTGWAVWPGSVSTAVPVAVNIGAQWYPLTADKANPAAEAALPGAGANHGYAGTFAVAPGTYNVCVWSTQPTGGAVQLGCKSVIVVAGPSTQAAVTSATGGFGALTVSGWAVWPGSPATSVPLAANIGANWYAITANKPSTAAETALPGSGPNHGFSATIAAATGPQSVCIWANTPTGGSIKISCHTVTVSSAATTAGELTAVSGAGGGITYSGWAVNPGSPTAPVSLAANVGGKWIPLTTGQPSTAAQAAITGAGANQGYTGFLPISAGSYSFCMWAVGPSGAVNLGCKPVTVGSSPTVVGALTSATAASGSVTVAGWAVWPSALTRSVPIAVNIGSSWQVVPSNLANTAAPTAVTGAGPNQGFGGTFAAPRGSQNVCIWASPPSGAGVLIGCQTVVVP